MPVAWSIAASASSRRQEGKARHLKGVHLVTRYLGGPDTRSNLCVLCRNCYKVMPEFAPGQHAQAVAWVLARN